MNKNIKKIGILAALSVGAYFLFSSFKSAEKPVTFGPEKPYSGTTVRKGYTRIETQSYDRVTKKKGALVPAKTPFTIIGTVTSSIGEMYVTPLGYMLQSSVAMRIVTASDVTTQNTNTNPVQTA